MAVVVLKILMLQLLLALFAVQLPFAAPVVPSGARTPDVIVTPVPTPVAQVEDTWVDPSRLRGKSTDADGHRFRAASVCHSKCLPYSPDWFLAQGDTNAAGTPPEET